MSAAALPRPDFTTQSGQSLTDMQSVSTNQTVEVDANYAAIKFTVGAGRSSSVDLQTGNVIRDGATLYRYVGAGANAFNLTDANIQANLTNFRVIGGTAGHIYRYVGSPSDLDLNNQDYTKTALWTDVTGGNTQVDLANTDYTDASNWGRVENLYVEPAAGSVATLGIGDLVRLRPDYATPKYTVGAAGQATVNLQTGDVIADGSTLYRYNGNDTSNFSLTDQAITADTTDFKTIGGQGGATYENAGPAGQVDLNNTDYTLPGRWKPFSTDAAAASVQTPVQATLTTSGPVNIVSTYTALGGGATPSYSNPQNLKTGDAVTLDNTYDTPTYKVGRPTSVNLQTGNVIQDGATLYRYVGTGANAFDLSDANIQANLTNFRVIGGISGDIYTYIGAGAQVDLANTDYTDAPNWRRVDNLYYDVASVGSDVATLGFGDLVRLGPNYATPEYTVGAIGQATVNLQAGDVIADGSTLYRYNGNDANNFSLTDQAITGNTVDFTAIAGQGGATYEYVGPTAQVALNDTDYTNPADWNPVTPAPSAPLATGGLVDVVATYTALGGGATPSYNNLQNLQTDDTVLLDSTYDTPTYTVGAGRSGSVNLQTGNVIQDGATLYRYVGTGANAFSLTDANIQANLTNFKVIGGLSASVYQYIGSGAPASNFTTQSGQGATDLQSVATNQTVKLDASYAAITFTVGAGRSASVNLQTGNIIRDGATLYRYVGTGANAFSLTDANIQANLTNFKVIGGTAGHTYQYVGSSSDIDLNNQDYTNTARWTDVTGRGARVDLANTDYTDGSNWQRIDNLYVAPAASAVATLGYGDLVQLAPDYATPKYTVGAVGQATVNLQTGDVIADGSEVVEYVGNGVNNFPLTDQAITADTTDFKTIGRQGGATYEYVGPTAQVAVNSTDYTNPAYWNPTNATARAQISAQAKVLAALNGLIPSSTYTALGGGATPSYNNPHTLKFLDTVTLDKTYDTPT